MNRTLVISIDALITADIPRLRQLPHLGRIMEGAACAKDILCIYPTLTYPCHRYGLLSGPPRHLQQRAVPALRGGPCGLVLVPQGHPRSHADRLRQGQRSFYRYGNVAGDGCQRRGL